MAFELAFLVLVNDISGAQCPYNRRSYCELEFSSLQSRFYEFSPLVKAVNHHLINAQQGPKGDELQLTQQS